MRKHNENNIKNPNLQQARTNNKQQSPVYIFALGGLGEVGKNMYVIEQDNDIWIMDSGIKFASEKISAEGIIPSFEYLVKNKEKIKGLIITHGHEDHIGAVPHLVNAIKIPKIYAGKIAANLIISKLNEQKLPKQRIEIINNKKIIEAGNFRIEFFNVNHSIPDCYGIVFHNKNGVIINTGDFKFDLSPVGVRADFAKMTELGQAGVTVLLSDSTNANSEKFSFSEMDVRNTIDRLVRTTEGRIIISTFASNVYRVREIILIAQKYKRKVAIIGYSMEKVIRIARKIKQINVNDDLFIKSKDIKKSKDDHILILSTGTQGEKNAGLTKIANNTHKEIKVRNGDTVIFASSAIPGNYEPVEEVTNKLIKLGCDVINNKIIPKVHASGHGGRQEQLIMFNLIKPKYFLPVHGELAMQLAHGRTGEASGINKKNIFILGNGDRVKLQNEIVTAADRVVAEDIYVDETNLTGQSMKIIADREKMAKNGIVMVVVKIFSKENRLIEKIFIESKGILNHRNNQKAVENIEKTISENINNYYKQAEKITFAGLKDTTRFITEQEFFKLRGINPIVVPIILNYNKDKHEQLKIT